MVSDKDLCSDRKVEPIFKSNRYRDAKVFCSNHNGNENIAATGIKYLWPLSL